MEPTQRTPTTGSAEVVKLDPARWVERYGDSLWRFAMSRVHDQQAAEELIQEAFAAALGAKDRFAGGSSELTWLTGILNHKIMDHFRKLKRRRESSAGGDDEDGGSFFDRHASSFASNGHWNRMPGAISDREEVDERLVLDLSDCKDRLPDNLAQPFLMREVQGMDGPTICKALGLTPTNLWTRLHRARAALRDCLERKWARRSA